jgi:hypothetical protein
VGEVPEATAAKLAAEHGIRRAVETGTYYGNSTKRLARIFPIVETIELSPRFALRARIRFLTNRNVRVIRGDSADVLRPAEEPTLYWLDAHWSGANTAGRESECPVLDELRLTSPGHPLDCYLVDDARLFIDPPPPPHKPEQWPTLDEVKALLAEIRPTHSLSVENDIIMVTPTAD